jgi:hypothetical protein
MASYNSLADGESFTFLFIVVTPDLAPFARGFHDFDQGVGFSFGHDFFPFKGSIEEPSPDLLLS